MQHLSWWRYPGASARRRHNALVLPSFAQAQHCSLVCPIPLSHPLSLSGCSSGPFFPSYPFPASLAWNLYHKTSWHIWTTVLLSDVLVIPNPATCATLLWSDTSSMSCFDNSALGNWSLFLKVLKIIVCFVVKIRIKLLFYARNLYGFLEGVGDLLLHSYF